MKHLVVAALGCAVLLCGCASPDNNNAGPGAQDSADRGTTTLGSLIPRKNGNRGDVVNVDKQAMENERTMGNGSLSATGR